MRVQLRLARYLRESGTQVAWLAERIGVDRNMVYRWLSGNTSVPDARRERILEVLRERQTLPVDDDLFEREGSR